MRISGGRLKNHKLLVPKGTQTRPTSEKLRQTVFNICQHQIEEATFLDVFAGSGAMGIEALSRGARHVTFIENSRQALHTIKENLTRLNLTQQATVLSKEAFFALKQLEKQKASFDLIFVDPPYGQKIKGSTQTYLDAILSLLDQSNLLSERGILFFEESNSPTVHLNELFLDKERQVRDTRLYQYVKRIDS